MQNLLTSDAPLGESDRLERLALGQANQAHAQTQTMYGPVVQFMQLPGSDLEQFEFISPAAFLNYLSSTCNAFSNLLAFPNNSATLLLYGDEMTPGNPLRADGGRALLNFYYTFLEFPSWFLHKKDGWFVLASLRSSLIKQINGGVAGLITRIMRTLFVDDSTASLSKGIFLKVGNKTELIHIKFGGFFGDEKGLKEFLDYKGASGVKPCIGCGNVVNFEHKVAKRDLGEIVTLAEIDRTKFIQMTGPEVYRMHDRLEEIVTTRAKGFRDRLDGLEIKWGVNYNPHGPLADRALRSIIDPVQHYLRDWQHTFMSSGVAVLHIASVVRVMKAKKIEWDVLDNFSKEWVYPRTLKPHPDLFGKKYFDRKELKVKHFSSDVLRIIGILNMFMQLVLKPAGLMLADCHCFNLLHRITVILQRSPRMTPTLHATLTGLIDEYAEPYAKLYDFAIKVKFHHMLHLPDNWLSLGWILSCFVTERKHKDLKLASLHVYRGVEHTTTTNFLNWYMQEAISGRLRFKCNYLINPRVMSLPAGCSHAHAAEPIYTAGSMQTQCGLACKGDLALIKLPSSDASGDAGAQISECVGRLCGFFTSNDNDFYANVELFTPVDTDGYDWDMSSPSSEIIDATMISWLLTYMERRPNVISICMWRR